MRPIRWERLRDLAARVAVGSLFMLFSIRLLHDFLATGHLTGLLLLLSEFLVAALTVIRRRATLVDRSLRAGLMTSISLIGPQLLRTGGTALVPDAATAVAAGLGLVLVVMGKLTLGRSFGIAPANRGVIVGGPYAIVRHPIYTGYIITHAAYLVAHLLFWNVLVIVTADTALVLRALVEERVLGADVVYRAYCQRVGWHLVPGLF